MTANARVWRGVASWAVLAASFNLLWEVVQLPLYTIYETGTLSWIAFAVLHCTIGDVLIALGCYCAAALVTRRWLWVWERPLAGGATVALLGVLYTVFSEWLNVSVRASWQYAPAMPTIGGIGVAPLLQWLLLPPLMVLVSRRWYLGQQRAGRAD